MGKRIEYARKTWDLYHIPARKRKRAKESGTDAVQWKPLLPAEATCWPASTLADAELVTTAEPLPLFPSPSPPQPPAASLTSQSPLPNMNNYSSPYLHLSSLQFPLPSSPTSCQTAFPPFCNYSQQPRPLSASISALLEQQEDLFPELIRHDQSFAQDQAGFSRYGAKYVGSDSERMLVKKADRRVKARRIEEGMRRPGVQIVDLDEEEGVC